jgi:prepilin-type processing-associated H-X9-DG protein
MSTLYMFDKITGTGSRLPRTWVTGEDAKWISKLSNVQASAATIMMMDTVISENNDWNFFEVKGGGVYNDFASFDTSNHKSNKSASGHPGQYLPEGSNIAFADGHVDWRDFKNMRHRISSGMWFWW